MAEPMTYLDCHYDEERHVLLLASSVDAYEEDEETWISAINQLHLNGKFTVSEMDGLRVRSCARNTSFSWALGEYGEVWTYPRGKKGVILKVQLPDSGVRTKRHLGSPNRIRVIAGRPYVCGFAGQIYTLDGDNWVHMDDGVVEPEGTASSLDLEGIHGTAHDDLYVVGSRGFLARWDGHAWMRIPLLTDSYLGGVRAFTRDHVVAVGNDGVVVEWNGANWTVNIIPRHRQTLLSDVEMFDGDLYVAAVDKLLVRKDKAKKWEEVKLRVKEEPEFIRLAIGDGRLWAMGSKRVHSFDGKKWEAHVDPDNG